ncbi:hypothetical protein G15_0247 [Enterococcus avium]|nr:hypothetical protein G15_0247 [Enterococcus avium]
MKILKTKFAKIGLLLVILGSFGISQEVQADDVTDFEGNLHIDFDMKLPNGTPYTQAKVLVDIMEEYTQPTRVNQYLKIGGVDAKDILIPSVSGNYAHTYGMYKIGPKFNTSLNSFYYAYYTNLRILPEPYIKMITLGDVKTFRYNQFNYRQTWDLAYTYDGEDLLSMPNNKFNVLPDRTHVYKEYNYLTSAHNRPTIEFASLMLGNGTIKAGYCMSSVAKDGKKVNFIANPYQIKENYVDKAGNLIPPPIGFTQGNLTSANANQFTHTLNVLPTSYTTGGKTYKLIGSYNGPTKPGTLSQNNPPSITVDYTDSSVPNFDKEGQITSVYALQAKLTEKYVDESGVQIDPLWDSSAPIDVEDGETFTIPYVIGDQKVDTGGKTWEYVGWKYNTDPAGTKRTTATTGPIIGDTAIQYIYKLSKTTASLNLTPTPKIVANNGTVSWSSRLENTGGAPLKDLVLKATSNWSAGLSNPVQVTVTPAGGSPQDFTVNPGDWSSGVNLSGITIPNGGANNYADITFTTTASGAVNQVLPAEIEVSGNILTPVKAENFVRIDDPDEPNLKPVGNAGLINIPDFRFGEVEVKPFAQTKGLDASAYRSGYHPYIRFMDNESTGGWSLSAKLGQFTSGTKTLPTTTTLKLRNGVLMDVQNYNKHNESLSYVDLTGSINIPSDSSTVALTNNTNRGVYHLEYDIANVELDLMAHSGIAGLSYQADMDWTLTTAP